MSTRQRILRPIRMRVGPAFVVMHGTDDRQLVGDAGRARQQAGELHSRDGCRDRPKWTAMLSHCIWFWIPRVNVG